jgi:protein-tyrosine phosphatase
VLAETYAVHEDPVERHWIGKHPNDHRLMVGGDIVNLEDLRHLCRDFNIGAIINVATEQSNNWDALHRFKGKVDLLERPFWDHGEPILPNIIHDVVGFARTRRDSYIYVHCHLGRVRSPSMIYAILVGAHGMLSGDAVKLIRESNPNYMDPGYRSYSRMKAYFESINRALLPQIPNYPEP